MSYFIFFFFMHNNNICTFLLTKYSQYYNHYHILINNTMKKTNTWLEIFHGLIENHYNATGIKKILISVSVLWMKQGWLCLTYKAMIWCYRRCSYLFNKIKWWLLALLTHYSLSISSIGKTCAHQSRVFIYLLLNGKFTFYTKYQRTDTIYE